MTTTDTTKLSPLKLARAERDAARATLGMYRHLHAIQAAGETPDIVRKWSGALHYDADDHAHAYRVELRWWRSTRADEGYVEIVCRDSGDPSALPVAELHNAMDLRAACRDGSYHAPWRYDVASMLAMSLSQREAEIARSR